MNIYDSIVDTIGNTPMVRLNRITKGLNVNIIVKCEYLNPSGSIKDRIALRMINTAEKEGKLTPGGTVTDSSTGNTATALSFICSAKGYRSKMCMPKGWISEDKRNILESYGAEIIEVPVGEEIEKELSGKAVHGGVVEIMPRIRAMKFEENDPGNTWYARQAMNPENVAAHREGTGQEIIKQTGGKFDAFVCAVGTGGTLLGVAEALKVKNPKVKIYAVEPATSSLFKMASEIKKYMKKYSIPGVRGWIIDEIVKKKIADDIFLVNDEEAQNMTDRLCREEGIFCGLSGGANVYVALKIAQRMKKNDQVVTILPDNRYRYFTTRHFTT
jgi:cysteine synthase